jgi:hypothetical protein
MNKYGARRTAFAGRDYASAAEARRALELRAREMAGEIADVEHQPAFDCVVNGVLVCRYLADFSFTEAATGNLVIEDIKSPATARNPTYRLKKKLTEALFGIRITEVIA